MAAKLMSHLRLPQSRQRCRQLTEQGLQSFPTSLSGCLMLLAAQRPWGTHHSQHCSAYITACQSASGRKLSCWQSDLPPEISTGWNQPVQAKALLGQTLLNTPLKWLLSCFLAIHLHLLRFFAIHRPSIAATTATYKLCGLHDVFGMPCVLASGKVCKIVRQALRRGQDQDLLRLRFESLPACVWPGKMRSCCSQRVALSEALQEA